VITLFIEINDPAVEKLLAIAQSEFPGMDIPGLESVFRRAGDVLQRAWTAPFITSADIGVRGLSLSFPRSAEGESAVTPVSDQAP
jgi:hypothetical protein